MTIFPDLYLEGDSKTWKNWQAIYYLLAMTLHKLFMN